MTEPLFLGIIGVLMTPLGIFLTWFFNRKKHVAEIYGVLTESSQTAVETMQVTLNVVHQELKEAQEKIVILNEKLARLEKELVRLHDIIIEKDRLLEEKNKENVSLRERIYLLTATIQGWNDGNTPHE